MMQKRLLRMGRNVEILSGDGRDLAEQVLRLGAKDILVTFAFRRQPRQYGASGGACAQVGAPSIAISGSLGPALAPAPDLLLSAPRSGLQ